MRSRVFGSFSVGRRSPGGRSERQVPIVVHLGEVAGAVRVVGEVAAGVLMAGACPVLLAVAEVDRGDGDLGGLAVVAVLVLSSPSTRTSRPLVRYLLTNSACARHATQSMKLVIFWPSLVLRPVSLASRKLVIATPLGVCLSSGSAVSRPCSPVWLYISLDLLAGYAARQQRRGSCRSRRTPAGSGWPDPASCTSRGSGRWCAPWSCRRPLPSCRGG